MSKYITEKVRWQCRVPKWPADNGTVPLPRGEHGCPGSRGDTWSGLGGTKITNHRVEPLHSQATESPEKMQGVLNLDPSCFLGFFFSFFFFQLENLLDYQGRYLGLSYRIRFYLHSGQMTVSLTVSKIPILIRKTLEPRKATTWLNREIYGDLLSLICSTEYWESMSWEYISYMQPRVGERKIK